MEAYLVSLLILFAIFAIAALGLNLALGWTGIAHLGYAGLMGVGAYTSAILTTREGWSVWAGMIAGTVVASGVSALLGWFTRRLEGDALAVVLLGFNLAFFTIAVQWVDLTRGPYGIPGIPRPVWFASDLSLALVCFILLFVVSLFAFFLSRSSFGRVVGAIRDDELFARSLGHRTFRYKLAALAIAGALAGLSGALYAHDIRFIDPTSFFLPMLVLVLSIIYAGGLGSVRGTIAGAAVMTFLPEAVRFLPGLPPTLVGPLRGIIFSALLLLVVLAKPKGLFGRVILPSYASGD